MNDKDKKNSINPIDIFSIFSTVVGAFLSVFVNTANASSFNKTRTNVTNSITKVIEVESEIDEKYPRRDPIQRFDYRQKKVQVTIKKLNQRKKGRSLNDPSKFELEMVRFVMGEINKDIIARNKPIIIESQAIKTIELKPATIIKLIRTSDLKTITTEKEFYENDGPLKIQKLKLKILSIALIIAQKDFYAKMKKKKLIKKRILELRAGFKNPQDPLNLGNNSKEKPDHEENKSNFVLLNKYLFHSIEENKKPIYAMILSILTIIAVYIIFKQLNPECIGRLTSLFKDAKGNIWKGSFWSQDHKLKSLDDIEKSLNEIETIDEIETIKPAETISESIEQLETINQIETLYQIEELNMLEGKSVQAQESGRKAAADVKELKARRIEILEQMRIMRETHEIRDEVKKFVSDHSSDPQDPKDPNDHKITRVGRLEKPKPPKNKK